MAPTLRSPSVSKHRIRRRRGFAKARNRAAASSACASSPDVSRSRIFSNVSISRPCGPSGRGVVRSLATIWAMTVFPQSDRSVADRGTASEWRRPQEGHRLILAFINLDESNIYHSGHIELSGNAFPAARIAAELMAAMGELRPDGPHPAPDRAPSCLRSAESRPQRTQAVPCDTAFRPPAGRDDRSLRRGTARC